VLSEEDAGDALAQRQTLQRSGWMDPLDGTKEFIPGPTNLRQYCPDRAGQVRFGVVGVPAPRDSLFWGGQGGLARLAPPGPQAGRQFNVA